MVGPNEGFYEKHRMFDYTVNFANPIRSTENKVEWGLGSRMMEGFAKHYLFASYKPNKKNTFRLGLNSLYRFGNFNRDYLFFPDEWSSDVSDNGNGRTNTFFQADWFKSYRRKKSAGLFRSSVRLPIPTRSKIDNYNYTYVEGELKHLTFWKKFDIKTRLFARFGMGALAPTESALYMQGANPEELMEDKYTRTHGIMPSDLGGFSTAGFANMHAGGGLNLRGYNGYYAIDENENGDLFINYKGLSGASASIEVEFDRFFKIRPKKLRNWLHFDSYLFADGGAITRGEYNPDDITENNPTTQWSKFRMDAGAGLAMTIKKWGKFQKAKPLTVRFDVPFFLSAPPFGQEYLDFRWVLGVNRAF